MDIFPNFLLLVTKIRTRRIGWLLNRIKQELRSPSYWVAKPIAVGLEYVRVLIRRLAKLGQLGDIDEHLLAVYDLNSSPVTFDFAYFLAYAETFARNNGKKILFVLFVMKDNEVHSENTYADAVDEASQKWRFNHIIIPLVNVYPACVGYSVFPKGKSIKPYLDSALVFPKGYSETFKPTMNYSEIFKSLRIDAFEGVSASVQGIRYVEKWRLSKGLNAPIVCITLRKYGYDTSRNSNINAWVQFADWISERGYAPVFIPDTDACWEPDERIDKYHVFNEGCWNLELRLALYKLAYVNYFYSNGCGALATLGKDIRYILMLPILEDSLHSTGKVFESYGFTTDQRRLEFASHYQLISLKNDSFDNICYEFLEFTEVNERAGIST